MTLVSVISVMIFAVSLMATELSAAVTYGKNEILREHESFLLPFLNSSELAQFLQQVVPVQNVTPIQSGSCQCGQLNAKKRIVGGTEPPPHKYPGLCFLYTPVNGGGAACGSALIDGWNALTAAHCVRDMVDNPTLFCGIQRTDGQNIWAGISIQVQNVIIHESYDNPPYDNDIAVLQLATQAPCTTNVSPLCLPSSPADYEGKLCWAAGWGRTSWTTDTAVLQEMTTTVQLPGQCKITNNFDGNNMICLDQPSSGSSLCMGDSGGPIMCQGTSGKYVVAGLNSFVVGQCEYPNVSAKVFSYLSWLAPKLKTG